MEITIKNIPDLSQFIDINSQSLQSNLNYLGEWRPLIDDFIAIIQALRVEWANTTKARKQKQDHYYYYHSSLEFFAKHCLASIERLLQRHISYASMHCRVAVESFIILYLHCKGDITLGEIENGKRKGFDDRNLYKKAWKDAMKLITSDSELQTTNSLLFGTYLPLFSCPVLGSINTNLYPPLQRFYQVEVVPLIHQCFH